MVSRRIVVFVTVALSLLGLMAFLTMSREEDPRIKRRNAIARLVVPGASPDRIFRQFVRPIEDELAKVPEIKNIRIELRLNVAVLQFELKDDLRDLPAAWSEVERALSRVTTDPPVLDFGVLDIESIVLAIVGGDDLTMIDEAMRLRDEIRKAPSVAEVRIFGSPQLEIRADVDVNHLFRHGISVAQLIQTLQSRNSGQPSGYLVQDGERIVLDSRNDLSTLKAFENVSFETQNFSKITLGKLAHLRRTTLDPPAYRFRFNGQDAIGVGVVAREGINIETFGKMFSERLPSYEQMLRPLSLKMVAFQPERTSTRIRDLLMSLLTGMLLIGVILGLVMGPTPALMVVSMVPNISLIGLFSYYLTGGVLHQISIAAFIISIGQFIDNIIVVIDQMQTRINSGEDRDAAAQHVIQQLRWPLAFATLTGICAFLPMLSAQGSTADFVFALPLVAVLTLGCSYFVSLFFTPLVAARFLKARTPKASDRFFSVAESAFAWLALGPYWRVSLLIVAMIALSLLSVVHMRKDFFPESDRQEFLLSIELPQSADISSTLTQIKEVEDQLSVHSSVLSYAAFAGGDIPKFYYNLPSFQNAPNVGQVLITLKPGHSLKALGLELESSLSRRFPETSFTALFLQQGPPIPAKVELRFFSENAERRNFVAQQLGSILPKLGGLRALRLDHTMGLRVREMEPRDDALASLGLSHEEFNRVLAFYSTGLVVSSYRHDREILNIRLRAENGPYRDDIDRQLVIRGRDRDFTIGDLAEVRPVDKSPLIRRKNQQTYWRALADLQPSTTFSDVYAPIQHAIASIELLPGERWEFGGDEEGAGEANASILKVVPLAICLLILFLLIEFRSYRKVVIASIALPISLLGVFPALWITRVPFGFMSLLGLLALVGVVVNNIILLLEAVNEKGSLEDALRSRVRAILLTTILTLAGLVPLAFDESALWPPLAWTMISGLISGTIATLIVVPVLLRLFFRIAAVVLLSLGILSGGGSTVTAAPQDIQMIEALDRGSASQEFDIPKYTFRSAEAQEEAQWKETWLPRTQFGGEFLRRREPIASKTPFGPLENESRERADLRLELHQKLFDASSMLSGRERAKAELELARLEMRRDTTQLRYQHVEILLGLLKLRIQKQSMHDHLVLLSSRLRDLSQLRERGRMSQVEIVKLEVMQKQLRYDLDQASIDETKLRRLAQRRGLLHEGENLVFAFPSLSTIDPNSGSSWTVQALQQKSRSLDHEADRIVDTQWPQLGLFARASQTHGRSLVENHQEELGVRLTWEIPFDGLRRRQATQVRALKMAVDQRSQIMDADEKSEIMCLQQRFQEQQRRFTELSEITDRLKRVGSTEERRYREGRLRLTELVEIDQIKIDNSRNCDLLKVEMLETCAQMELLAGAPIRACQ